MCGFETRVKENIGFCEFKTYSGDVIYQSMVCKNFENEIRKLIDNNFMVIDPEELRK